MSRKLDFDALKNLGLLTHVGMIMILPIIGSIMLGNFVDNWLGTGYIFTFIFILLGILSGFLNLLKLAQKKIEESRKRNGLD
jgi:F0F1-type ATP synthase assembly protein I